MQISERDKKILFMSNFDRGSEMYKVLSLSHSFDKVRRLILPTSISPFA